MFENNENFFKLLTMSTLKSVSVFRFIQCLYKLVVNHVQTMYTELDAVKDAQVCNLHKNNQNTFQIHKHYVLPEIIVLLVLFDSLFIFYCNNFYYSDTSMPTLFFHLVFPEKLWKVGDITTFIILINALITYSNLIFDNQLDNKYVMYLFTNNQYENNNKTIMQNEKPLSRFETKKIITFRSKVKQILPYNLTNILLLVEAFCLYNFYIHWTSTFHCYFIFVVFHVFVPYTIYCK